MIVLINSNIACCPIIYRFLHQIKEDNSELINKLRTDIQQKVATQSQITTSSGTPSSPSPSGEQKGLVPDCISSPRVVAYFIMFFLKHSNFLKECYLSFDCLSLVE